MTAPKLENWKFWIVKPKAGTNQIKNPRFDPPDGVEDWTASGAGVTIASTGDEARRGAYSMKVNPADNVGSSAYYGTASVTNGLSYTFSCDVKGTAGQAMSISIRSSGGAATLGTTSFTATGYWQRQEVTGVAVSTAADYRAVVTRAAVASTDPFYVDGAQFEQASAASTFFSGYSGNGCRWTGLPRNSSSERSAFNGLGGELIDISTYAKIISVQGLGNGQWNQVLTKMTSGGDMYQTHIRKSRNFSMVLAYHGDNQGDLQANRKVIIDALRPDYLFGEAEERRIIRYQGFDANGVEATQPVDIICVPQPSLTDTPSMPMFQKDMLNFTIPSGLLQGAYNEGAELDWVADFPAEYIVRRDPEGRWYKDVSAGVFGNPMEGQSSDDGLNGLAEAIESPSGKIYVGGTFTNAGGVAEADYLARWNPVSEEWESVLSGINGRVRAMAFDSAGDLYIGGDFTDLGSSDGDSIVKITDPEGTPVVSALGTGINGIVSALAINTNGELFVGGSFMLAGGVANTWDIAKWDGTTWSPLATGLNLDVLSLAIAPNGNLYIGGLFTNADGTNGDYLCYWDGTAFHRVGTVELNSNVYTLAFDGFGRLYIGGAFTNAGGIANADYIARWNGQSWNALGTGVNGAVYNIVVTTVKSYSLEGIITQLGNLYASGAFTTAGGLTLTDRVAVWSNGAWQPLDINLPGAGIAYSILPASDGSLYVGGDFTTAGTAGTPNATCAILSDRVYEIGVASASANTYPYMQVFGPGTLKSIANYSTGKTITFDGLTLQAGEVISLNFDPLNLQFVGAWAGRGNLMRYVVAGSDYGDFYLKPGSNLISLFMTSTTSASRAWMAWTPLFWGLDGALL